MEGRSRNALATAREREEAVLGSLDAAAARTLGSELAAVAGLLDGNYALRRSLSDDDSRPADRAALIRRVLGGQVGEATLAFLGDVVGLRWSSALDLTSSLGGPLGRGDPGRRREAGLARRGRGRAVPLCPDPPARGRAVAGAVQPGPAGRGQAQAALQAARRQGPARHDRADPGGAGLDLRSWARRPARPADGACGGPPPAPGRRGEGGAAA